MALQVTNVAMSDGGGRSSKSTYNVEAAKSMMNDIKSSYEELGSKIVNGWENIINTLQKNWVGVDEQSYEETFANKVSTLYAESFKVADTANKVIAAIAEAYRKAQSQNVFDGQSELDTSGIAVVPAEIVKPSTNKVAKRKREITKDMDLGLTSPSAATNIKSAINSYVNKIKGSTENLYNKCANGTNKFITDENVKAKLKLLIKQLGTLSGEVNTAVKDMYTGIDKLVTENYGGVAKSVSSEIDEMISEIQNTDIGESRWS